MTKDTARNKKERQIEMDDRRINKKVVKDRQEVKVKDNKSRVRILNRVFQ